MRNPLDLDATIVALSSPPGGAPRAVVRLSGARAWELSNSLLDPPLPDRPWRRSACALTLPGWPAAAATVVTFRGPRSYTGEDLVELWVPGAPPLVRRLLLVLQERGARLAERGEFTRRAFLAGRLDLTQVEAVLALTTSEDAREARAALRALGGGVSDAVDAAKHALADVLAHVEAAIDFSEEELDLTADAALATRLDEVRGALAALRRRSGGAPAAGTEPVVALRGPANAGKSSLFNALVGGDAIVSDQAGTTRDVIRGTWRLPGGRAVRLLDTAGHAPALGSVEEAALALAAAAAETADLVLHVRDATESTGDVPVEALLVRTKADLAPAEEGDGLLVSAHTGQGLDALARTVSERLGRAAPATDLFGSARQEALLQAAEAALERAISLLRGSDPARAELAAIDLADALEALGRLTGAVGTEEILGRIFANFCIGK